MWFRFAQLARFFLPFLILHPFDFKNFPSTSIMPAVGAPIMNARDYLRAIADCEAVISEALLAPQADIVEVLKSQQQALVSTQLLNIPGATIDLFLGQHYGHPKDKRASGRFPPPPIISVAICHGFFRRVQVRKSERCLSANAGEGLSRIPPKTRRGRANSKPRTHCSRRVHFEWPNVTNERHSRA